MADKNDTGTFNFFKRRNENKSSSETKTSSDTKTGKKNKPFEITQEAKGENKMFSDKPNSHPFILAILFTTLKVMFVVALLFCAGAVGLVLGVAKAYVDTTPMLELSALTESNKTSYIYDSNGTLITTYAGMEYREWADIDEIPTMLTNAVVAVEDVRFYKHDGVDYKRLISAIINTFRNEDTHGGSTITQQLIKNTILTDIQSYKRKIQEAYLALQLNDVSDKEEVLEAYLNQVYLGDQNYGVKSAAKDYFGKELSDLSVRECAMLAGMIQKPNSFNPRLNTYSRVDDETGENMMSRTDTRTDLVIEAMYDAGFISLEQRDYALKDTVSIVEVSAKSKIYEMAYFVEYGIYDVITQMLEYRGLVDTTANRAMIENELRTSGYHIYLSVNSDIQHILEEEVAAYDNYPKLKKSSASVYVQENADGTTTEIEQPQVSAVVFDHNTGYVVAMVGGRTPPTQLKAWNRAYMSALEVGSSIKPLAVYGPALDLGLSPASIIYNIPGRIEGWDTEKGYPSMGGSDANPVTMRRGIRSSLNVVAARVLLENVGLETSAQYLMNLGISEDKINVDGSGLALGTSGITTLQMAAAFGTIANGGVYNEPLAFTKVLDSEGRTVLDAAQVRESHRVYKDSTAFLLVDMLTDAVSSGTGTRARISGMTVAGKTGTNSDYSSVCFSGMTPYYTATVWIGHDYPQNVLAGSATGGKYAAPLWKNFMSRIHENLEDREILDYDAKSLGLVKKTVCSVSGLLATDACKADETHGTVMDWFLPENVPEEKCDMHILLDGCDDTGEFACDKCISISQKSYVIINVNSPYRQFGTEYLLEIFPNGIFTDGEETAADYVPPEGSRCSMHSSSSFDHDLEVLIRKANSLIAEVKVFMATPDAATPEEIMNMTKYITYLEMAISIRDKNYINLYYGQLNEIYEAAKS